MIVGHGDIASVLNDRHGVIFFASGVSNSAETSPAEFNKEHNLLENVWHNVDPDMCLFYFSTITKYEKDSPYLRHKSEMEMHIRNLWKYYCILRIGNITWGKNPNTFLNKMRLMKFRGEQLNIRDEYKYMITQKDLGVLTDCLPTYGQFEICAFSYMSKVKDLL